MWSHLEGPNPQWTVEAVGENPVVLFHVPHAGLQIPPDVRADIILDDKDLEAELLVMTDWHTDEIARRAAGLCGVDSVSFINQLSRLVVDPERLPDDVEPMAAVGMGAVYRATSVGGVLRDLDAGRDAHLRATYFDWNARALAELVDGCLEESDSITIIDVHSYASEVLPYERDHSAPRPGVCIGVDEFHTPGWMIESASSAFDGVPGGVGLDTPFAGTYVPLRHYRKDARVRSVMVEIRRDLYIDESTATVHAGIEDIVGKLASFVESCASAT